jgi:hypothetical protein
MRSQSWARIATRLAILAVLATTSPRTGAMDPQQKATAPAGGDPRAQKTVALEVFVSQGCDLCPSAELLLGKLDAEFGPERVVPISFHVDYFNDAWKDPYSDPQFSRREWQYSQLYAKAHAIKNDAYLYLTPLLMVDGRVAMVGSNEDTPARARAAIRNALAQPAVVAIEANLNEGAASADRTLSVRLAALDESWAEREVLLEVVTLEDGLSTSVGAGELRGRTYNSRHTARAFAFRPVTLPREGDSETVLHLTLPAGARPDRTSLAVLVQDEATGRILQARRLDWQPVAGSIQEESTEPKRRAAKGDKARARSGKAD